MRSLLRSLLGYFLSPSGIVLLGALDASAIFFLPFGIDFVVIIMSARTPGRFWLYALLAALGSVIGAGVTFWIGRAIGRHGLARFVPASRLERIERRVGTRAAAAVAALGIIPPPFPFTAFVLTSGAVGGNPVIFLSVLAAVRAARFAVEGGLAALYGRRLLIWMESPIFEGMVGALIVLAVAGTVVSAVAVIRDSRRGDGRGSPR